MEDKIEFTNVQPIHRSLTQPILIMEVPRAFAFFNGTMTMAFVFGLHSFYILPFNILFHFIFVAVTKKDPLFFDIFKVHLWQKKYYDI